MNGERGTALLITLVLIAVIGSIAFGVGRASLTNLRQTSRLEDSLDAYQAARAGIEDALLRFKFDKNAEAPTTAIQGCSRLPDITKDSQVYARVDLSVADGQPTVSCPNLAQGQFPTNPNDIVYDLKMYHKRPVGQDECVAVPSYNASVLPGCTSNLPPGVPALRRDTAVEYDVSDVQSGPITINASFAQPDALNQIEVLELNNDGSEGAHHLLRTFPTSEVIKTPQLARIRLRPFQNDLQMYDLRVAAGSLDSRFTTVESIGYFGVSKRKLTLTLDRLSGSIFDVFDFVLFSGTGSICGPAAKQGSAGC